MSKTITCTYNGKDYDVLKLIAEVERLREQLRDCTTSHQKRNAEIEEQDALIQQHIEWLASASVTGDPEKLAAEMLAQALKLKDGVGDE